MAVIVITLDGSFLDGAVHPLNLPIRPRMFDFGEPVLDVIFLAPHIEHVGHVRGSRPVGISWRKGELDSIVGQDGVDLVGNSLDQGFQEGRRGDSAGFSGDLNECEFARSVNGNGKIQLSLCWSAPRRYRYGNSRWGNA